MFIMSKKNVTKEIKMKNSNITGLKKTFEERS